MRQLRFLSKGDGQSKHKKQQNLYDLIGSKRLLIVSNRLPVVIDHEDDEWTIRPGTGGLITALAPIMKENRGIWIGWPGNVQGAPYKKLLDIFNNEYSFNIKPVLLSEDESNKYYYGFSNETIWPLFHDLLSFCKFDKDNWETYKNVNRKFAEAIAGTIEPDNFIWIHDYHLTLVGHYLKEINIKHDLAYFLHIPFPSFDLFRRLPWRNELINGMMSYDLLGFQTLRDRRNFIHCVKSLNPAVKIVVKRRYSIVFDGDRTVKVGNYPISIDFDEFNNLAKTKEVADEAWFFHEKFNAKRLILGIDRLDYTKGIPKRFLAFERALEKYPELQGQLTLFQLLIPSRTPVPEYKQLKEHLDTMVGRINGRFSSPGWVPIHYMFRTFDRIKLLGVYKACEMALITPLRDGMNLVAKEYCASSIDNNGVLILSEFAGAADQLKDGAIIVNPYDLEQTADAIYRAFKMEPQERKNRMSKLRGKIKREDVHLWVRWFIESFRDRRLQPRGEDTVIIGEEQELLDVNLNAPGQQVIEDS